MPGENTKLEQSLKEFGYRRDPRAGVGVCHSRLQPESEPRAGKHLRFSIPGQYIDVRGNPLSRELTKITTREGWEIEEAGAFIKRYLGIVASLTIENGARLNMDKVETPLSGRHFELIPQNIIVGIDGRFHPIDQEWVSNEDISVGLLVFRALNERLNSKTRLGRTASDFKQTRMGFLLAAFHAAGLEVNKDALAAYSKLETSVQFELAQRMIKKEEPSLNDAPLYSKPIRDAYHEMRNRYDRSKENLARKSAELKAANARLRKYERSMYGRLTRLLRKLKPRGAGPGKNL